YFTLTFPPPLPADFKDMSSIALAEIIVFLFILGLGLLYAWKKRALRWE
ncbi:MAG: NADH-quinone oxidoreductase subunit A, partial [Flavobacteriia bacterium]